MGGETVIAFEEGVDLSAGEAEAGIEPFGGVAFAADILRDLEWGGCLEGFDLVAGMAVQAIGGIAMAAGDAFPVAAFFEVRGRLGMALGASGDQLGGADRGAGIAYVGDFVMPMAVFAGGRGDRAVTESNGVGAGFEGFGGALVAGGAVDGFGGMAVVGMFPPESKVLMTIHAQVRLVNGGFVFGFVDEQGERLAGSVGFGEVVLAVAFEAFVIGDDFLGGIGGLEGHPDKKGCDTEAERPNKWGQFHSACRRGGPRSALPRVRVTEGRERRQTGVAIC